MDNDFNYYMIWEANRGRTPMLTSVSDRDTKYLWRLTQVPEGTVTPLTFLQKMKKPDLNTDNLNYDGCWNVFSQRVKDALDKYMPIRCLQLVQASINDGEYMNFYIANIFQRLYTFDRSQCAFGEFNDGNDWGDLTKIILDRKVLSNIPLEERLVYISKEDFQFFLYHESVVDILKSVEPIGMSFLNIEEWNPGAAFDFMRQ
jgi:hypothetical protein